VSARFRKEIEKALKEGKVVVISSATARSEVKIHSSDKNKVKEIKLRPPV